MSTAVDRVLAERKARVPPAKRRGFVAVSFVLHAALTALLVLWPTFFKQPPKKFEFVAVTVVPPRALGETAPATRTPPAPKPPAPKPPEPQPETPPPSPEVKPAPAPPAPEIKKDPPKPLAPDPKAVKPPEKSAPLPSPAKEEPKKPAPPAATPPAPGPDSLPAAIPKRQGSPFGNPLGASTQQATLGVEDPNFTYGYYLDRIVGVISNNWVRPTVGPEIKQSLLYFRIQRDGTIIELRLVESSGSEVFDDAAMRAVQASSPLPPLPKSYGKDLLGIHLVVK